MSDLKFFQRQSTTTGDYGLSVDEMLEHNSAVAKYWMIYRKYTVHSVISVFFSPSCCWCVDDHFWPSLSLSAHQGGSEQIPASLWGKRSSTNSWWAPQTCSCWRSSRWEEGTLTLFVIWEILSTDKILFSSRWPRCHQGVIAQLCGSIGRPCAPQFLFPSGQYHSLNH